MGQNLALLKVTPIGSNALFSTAELLIHKDKQEYIIGRGPGVDLEINFREGKPSVSRKHLRFEVMDDNSVLINHNSTGRATYINGVLIAKSKNYSFPIYPGDTIYLTDYKERQPVVALRIDTPEPIQSSLIGRFTHSVYQEFEIGDDGPSRSGGKLSELKYLSDDLSSHLEYMNAIGEDASQEIFYDQQFSRLFKNISALTQNELLVAEALYQSTTKHGDRYGLQPNPKLQVWFSAEELAIKTGYSQTKETDEEEIEERFTKTEWNLKVSRQMTALYNKLLKNPDLDLDLEDNSKFQSPTLKEVYKITKENFDALQKKLSDDPDIDLNLVDNSIFHSTTIEEVYKTAKEQSENGGMDIAVHDAGEDIYDKANEYYLKENSYAKYEERFDKNNENKSSDEKKLKNAIAAIIRNLRQKLDRSYEYRVWEEKGKTNKRRIKVTKHDFLIKEESGKYFMERVHDFNDFNEANGIW